MSSCPTCSQELGLQERVWVARETIEGLRAANDAQWARVKRDEAAMHFVLMALLRDGLPRWVRWLVPSVGTIWETWRFVAAPRETRELDRHVREGWQRLAEAFDERQEQTRRYNEEAVRKACAPRGQA